MTTTLPPTHDLDTDRIVGLLLVAFGADPGTRWLFADPHRYRTAFPAMLRRGLERCDRDGRSRYLEASHPRNRALYERHGFETIGEIQFGDSAPGWPMLRPPR